MLHKLKKTIIRDTILSLWNQEYLSFEDTIILINQLTTLDCCQVNHWLSSLKTFFIEDYPATSKTYRL